MIVLVTGGRGFVGKNLQLVKPDWIYVGRENADLTSYEHCKELIQHHNPDAIVHLASLVGGIQYNINNPARIITDNVLMNTNVLEAARTQDVPRVLSCLSTCAFPDHVSEYPMTEDDILAGPPQQTNLPYSFSKRLLYVQTMAMREQYGLNYTCFCPSNIYGPCMDIDLDGGHLVGALINKIESAHDGKIIKVFGTGTPLRQQLYVKDLIKIIPLLLEHHNEHHPVIVAPPENLSVREITEECIRQSGKNLTIEFSGGQDGQYRKDGSSDLLFRIIGDFQFTPFSDGIKQTFDWFRSQE